MSAVAGASTDPVSFQELLEGPKAFYNQPDYSEKTKKELMQVTPLPVTLATKVKSVAMVLIAFLGTALILANQSRPRRLVLITVLTTAATVGFASKFIINKVNQKWDQAREKVNLSGEWKYKRLSLEIDGRAFDVIVVGRASTLGNRRWMLIPAVSTSDSFSLKELLKEIQGNAVIFLPSLDPFLMTKVNKAILKFLEDQEKGIGAKEIIAWNHWVPSENLNSQVKYVFVQKNALNFYGWFKRAFNFPGLHSKELSKELKAPEVILQTADVEKCEEIHNSEKIRDSEIGKANASLAKALLDDKDCPRENKVFIGVPKSAKDSEQGIKFVAQTIERLLKK